MDDEGDGDYTSIKEAVNNSNPGDIIEVYSGTYFEYDIHITQPNITLMGIPFELGSGNDTGKPFIDGDGRDLLYIQPNGNGTIIDGFQIENRGTHPVSTITLHRVNNCIISNSTIQYTHISPLFCWRSSHIHIFNNSIGYSDIRQGIMYYECSNMRIENNKISHGNAGILNWESDNNIITNNVITDCFEGIQILGINNTIHHNSVSNNRNGIALLEGYDNIITENNLMDNREKDAYFRLGIYTYPFRSTWSNNYWGRPYLPPKLILGRVLHFIPWVQFDWRPALLPHQIT